MHVFLQQREREKVTCVQRKIKFDRKQCLKHIYILFPRELINICIDHLENDVSGRLAAGLVSKSTES